MAVGDNMVDKVINLLKNSTIIVPRTLLNNYHELKISEIELIILMYLINDDTKSYNPKKISHELSIDLNVVLESINDLTAKDIISLEVRKVGNIREEFLSLDNLYNKLSFTIVNEKKPDTANKSNLFDTFEREFGRTLSPIEYELINGWQSGEFGEELILLALKEAVFNGVFNLRYIDKILYEWKKKGIKTKDDIEKERVNFKTRKPDKKELFDYDWLNEKE